MQIRRNSQKTLFLSFGFPILIRTRTFQQQKTASISIINILQFSEVLGLVILYNDLAVKRSPLMKEQIEFRMIIKLHNN